MVRAAKSEQSRSMATRPSVSMRSRAWLSGSLLGIVSWPAVAVTAPDPAGVAAAPVVLEGERHVEIVARPEQVPATIEAVRSFTADETSSRPVVVTIPWRG